MSSIPKPDLCNALAIRKAARHITGLYDRHLAGTGLKVTQYSVLAHLRGLGPRTINELAAIMATDRTTMGRNIRPLERDGLVSITPDPRDARRRALALTDLGLARLQAARAGWAAAQARFDEAYGPERAAALRETLAGVIALDFDTAR
jgi:DNA-binding MarR family transcriptional regulator